MSKTIGVIFCSWQAEEFLLPGPTCTLQPWVDLRARPGQHRLLIAAVSVPFIGFNQDEPLDRTVPLLKDRLERGHIDHLITSDTPMKETEARGAALKWLVAQGVDWTIQADSDERYLERDILKIAAFVESRPHIAAYRGSLKNYVFDDKTYLTEPFTPMRVHRVRHGTYLADSFWDDNNVLYRGTLTRDFKRDIDLPCASIPRAVAWTRHVSWPNSLRSKAKIAYQNARPGWLCDFAWDDTRGGLIWRDGVTPKETARDE